MIQLFSIQPNNSIAKREIAFAALTSNLNEPGVMLQTCNRIELYTGKGKVTAELAQHLFRVVSGLESNLLGETAIQGQVRNAYVEACKKYQLSASLHHLFQTALFVGKRVRNDSGISRGAMSHSQAAVEVISNSGINLNKALISLIGAHKLNEDIIRFLLAKGAETIFLANKSFEKAEPIARKYNCQVMKLDQLLEMLHFSDILISATSAPHLIVKYDDFPKEKQMLILDLAFPRDVDERIGQLPYISLHNLEHIEYQVNLNKDKRKEVIKLAEKIIELEVILFLEKQQRHATFINQP
jgi:glutamyl-tRNA reductase